MIEKTVNLSDESVLEALCSDEAMRVWYQLRVAGAPASAAELAATLRADVKAVHAALDLLEAAALVRKLRARAGKRAITYVVALDELVVMIPDDPEGVRRCERLVEVSQRRQAELIKRTRRFRQSGVGEWFFDQVTDFVATQQEVKELQRRVYEVSRYAAALASRVRPPDGGSLVAPRHVLQLRVAALVGEFSPIPEIHVLAGRAVRQQQGARLPSPETLGRREREIAKLLQGGLSRPEVATRLAISPQTVGSYCKRIYGKLGIRRATELGRYSFEGFPADPARGRRGPARG